MVAVVRISRNLILILGVTVVIVAVILGVDILDVLVLNVNARLVEIVFLLKRVHLMAICAVSLAAPPIVVLSVAALSTTHILRILFLAKIGPTLSQLAFSLSQLILLAFISHVAVALPGLLHLHFIGL